MIFTYEIKDEHIIAFAKAMGFNYPADNVPKIDAHIDAINSFARAWLDQFYSGVVNEAVKVDPTVLAKEQELAAAKKAVEDAIKPATADAAQIETKL